MIRRGRVSATGWRAMEEEEEEEEKEEGIFQPLSPLSIFSSLPTLE